MKSLLLILAIFLSYGLFAQYDKPKRKISNEKGSFFTSWGFNRTGYTKSNIHFLGQGYGFNLKYSKATDNQSKFGSGDYALNSISVPQYNFKIGYYYKKKWHIALSLDHFKYLFSDNNAVVFSGFASLDTNTVKFGPAQTLGKGYIANKNLKTSSNYFNYSNAKGLNYIHADIGWTEKLFVFGRKGEFVLSSNLGIGSGILISYTDLYFDQIQVRNVKSLSGFGISSFAGIRAEFMKHLFIYSNISAGFINKSREKTDENNPLAYVSQRFGYCQGEVGLGIILFKRVKNDCDDCPVW